MPIDRLSLEINERTGKFDSIGLNIRRFIYFIEYLYLWFITIDFIGLYTIDIMFMLVSWILLLIDWVILWIVCIRLWIDLLIVVLFECLLIADWGKDIDIDIIWKNSTSIE